MTDNVYWPTVAELEEMRSVIPSHTATSCGDDGGYVYVPEGDAVTETSADDAVSEGSE